MNYPLLLSSICFALLLNACQHTSHSDQPRLVTSTPTYSSNASVQNNGLRLRHDAPQTYVVKPGDTLWGISGRYLYSPWQWKQLWQANPAIKNPHLIYPGDVLQFENGRLSIKQRGDGVPTIKLRPNVRPTNNLGIPAISYDDVAHLLQQTIMVDPKSLINLPYIINPEGGTLFANVDQRAYVRGALQAGQTYDVFRENRRLGHSMEMKKVGTVLVERLSDSTEKDGLHTVIVTELNRDVIKSGDVLLPQVATQWELGFSPDAPPYGMSANVIAVIEGITIAGPGQTVVLDKGLSDGLQAGHVFVAQTRQATARDPRTGRTLQLPTEDIGTVMVYRVFDNTSFALVMNAPEPVRVGSRVLSPTN